eukprot:403366076
MNLNSAVFDNVLAIDERLKMLEQEVSEMDQYYQQNPPSFVNTNNNNQALGSSQQQQSIISGNQSQMQSMNTFGRGGAGSGIMFQSTLNNNQQPNQYQNLQQQELIEDDDGDDLMPNSFKPQPYQAKQNNNFSQMQSTIVSNNQLSQKSLNNITKSSVSQVHQQPVVIKHSFSNGTEFGIPIKNQPLSQVNYNQSHMHDTGFSHNQSQSQNLQQQSVHQQKTPKHKQYVDPLKQQNDQTNINTQLQNQAQTQQQSSMSQQQSRYQNLPQIQADSKSVIVKQIKPQISKTYEKNLEEGRPDFSILENEFEFGDKFYEPQYFGTVNDFDGECTMNVKFRESESQYRAEQRIMMDIMKTQANQYYDSFMF